MDKFKVGSFALVIAGPWKATKIRIRKLPGPGTVKGRLLAKMSPVYVGLHWDINNLRYFGIAEIVVSSSEIVPYTIANVLLYR